MALLTGPTDSGKSTMLGALQTVMTAVYQHLPTDQDETTQASRGGKSNRKL